MTEQRPGGPREPRDPREPREARVGREPERAPGYRGALPPRNDALARPWVLTVIGIFVLMIVLSFAGFPSVLFPSPSASPLPSVQPSSSFTLLPSSSVEASPQ